MSNTANQRARQRNYIQRRSGAVQQDVFKNIFNDGLDRSPVVSSKNPHAALKEHDPKKLNVNVETWADVDSITFPCWGDFWVKVRLYEELVKLGVNVNVHPQYADLTIYLWGSHFNENKSWPFGFNKKSFNVCWFYSHPDNMTKAELALFDVVCCLSENYRKENLLEIPNVYPHAVESCTNFRPPDSVIDELRNDISFIGNARGNLEFGRIGVHWLKNIDAERFKQIAIYGAKWEMERYQPFVKPEWIKGRYFPYEHLNELYAASTITLIDGHLDMCLGGFVPMKLYDVFASGGFPIMQNNTGVKAIFGDCVPMYETQDQLLELLDEFYNDPGKRERCIEQGQAIALTNTFTDRAKKFLAIYHEFN